MMSSRSCVRRVSALVVGGALVVASAACGSGAQPAAGGSCSSDGVSATEIQLGSLVSQTGPTSSVWAPLAQGVQARVGLENDNGGVNGRKLVLTTADDAGDTARNLAAARELVEGHDVLALLLGTSNTVGSGDYLDRKGVPVSGFGFSAEFEKYKNYISFSNVNPGVNGISTVTALWGQELKTKGATNVYVVGSSSPASSRSSLAYQASIKAAGLPIGAVTANLPLGTTNYGGEVEKAKAANVDGAAITATPQAAFAILAALRQAAVPLRTVLFSIGYDPGVFTTGTPLEDVTIPVAFAPFELGLPAHKTFNDAMQKYADAGPNQAYSMYGWLSADLIIQGIKDAGDCPTRQGVIDAISKIRGRTADGLIPPTDYTPDTRGTVMKCVYFVTIHSNTFVPDNNGQPVCATGDQYAVPFSG